MFMRPLFQGREELQLMRRLMSVDYFPAGGA